MEGSILFMLAFLIGRVLLQPKKRDKPQWLKDLFAPRPLEYAPDPDPELEIGSETLTVAENELFEPRR